MNIYLEETCLEYLHAEDYPVVQMFIESADLERETDRIRKAKGYATLFDRTDSRMQNGAWYDFRISFDAIREEVTSLVAEVQGEYNDETPHSEEDISLGFNSSELIRQIKKQLKELYGMELNDLKPEEEEK